MLPTDAAVFIRLAGEGVLRLRLKSWREAEFLVWEAREKAILGLYLGFLLAMVLYNGAVFASTRESCYGYYVFYLIGLTFLQMTLKGLGSQFFWPAAGGFSNGALVFFAFGTILSGSMFVRRFLSLRQQAPVLDMVLTLVCVISALSKVLSWLADYRVILLLMLAVAAVSVGAILHSIIASYVSGYRPARFLLLSFAALAPGLLVLALRAMGYLGETLLVAHIVETLTALEALLLAFALADRISLLEEERRAALTEVGATRNRYAREMVERQEHERGRIAGELHDSVGQSLLAIRNSLLRLARSQSADTVAALNVQADQAADTVAEVREICQDLHPHQLERLGLGAAIRAMAEHSFQSVGIEPVFDLSGADPPLQQRRRIHVFRIAQEAVSNVIRHADARHCWLSLQPDGDGGTVLTVADDGRGLALRENDQHAHFGLTNMRERARFAGGKLSIEARAGGGTSIRLVVPAGANAGGETSAADSMGAA